MNTAVRDFVRLETNGAYFEAPFDEIFYYFKRIIEYDIDIDCVEGISERLGNSLQTISGSKLDRSDMLTLFPAVWASFEPFTKKVLYLVDEEAFNRITSDKHSSIVDYLKKLGFPVFVEESKRTINSNIIYNSYLLRNDSSHECRKYSNGKLYKNLDNILAALLIIVDKNLEKIKAGMTAHSIYHSCSFELTNNQQVMRILNTLDMSTGCLADFSGIKTRTIKHFDKTRTKELYDEKGRLASKIVNSAEITYKYSFQYDENINGDVDRCVEISVFNDPKHGGDYTRDEDSIIYSYNDEDKLYKIDYYDKNKEGSPIVTRTIMVEYEDDGSLTVSLIDINRRTGDARKVGVYHYDNMLRKISGKNGLLTMTYEYAEDGSLKQIKEIGGTFYTVEVLGDNVFVKHHINSDDEGKIIEKWKLNKDGRIVTKQIARQKNNTRLIRYEDSPSTTIFYEYY